MRPWAVEGPSVAGVRCGCGRVRGAGRPGVGVAGVGVAPGEVGLQAARQHRVIGVIGAAHHEGPQRPELRLDRVCHEALVGVKHSSALCFFAQARMAGVLFADRLSMIT